MVVCESVEERAVVTTSKPSPVAAELNRSCRPCFGLECRLLMKRVLHTEMKVYCLCHHGTFARARLGRNTVFCVYGCVCVGGVGLVCPCFGLQRHVLVDAWPYRYEVSDSGLECLGGWGGVQYNISVLQMLCSLALAEGGHIVPLR